MQDKLNKLKSKHPELYKTEPRKENDLAYLKSKPYRLGNFHWYANPVIGYKHVTDPSKTEKKGKSFGKVTRSKSYPF